MHTFVEDKMRLGNYERACIALGFHYLGKLKTKIIKIKR